jgi:hypothetical protein
MWAPRADCTSLSSAVGQSDRDRPIRLLRVLEGVLSALAAALVDNDDVNPVTCIA